MTSSTQGRQAGPPGLLLSDDLIFTSRITGTAQALGLTVKAARSVGALIEMARHGPPGGVIVDLANPGLDVPELLRRLREVCPQVPRVTAYGSHVDAAGLKAARDAGCDLVLPRSAFVEKLPRDLPDWLTLSGRQQVQSEQGGTA
jgi:CheY-like chemotaxis protein